MIILDTDCLSLLQRKQGAGYFELAEALARFPSDQISTTIISFDEQMRGWMAMVARARTTDLLTHAYADLLSFLERFSKIPVLPFDETAGQFLDELKRQKLRVGTMDLRIASIAISREAILVSRNLVDFERIPNPIVEDWTKKSYFH